MITLGEKLQGAPIPSFMGWNHISATFLAGGKKEKRIFGELCGKWREKIKKMGVSVGLNLWAKRPLQRLNKWTIIS